MTDLKLDLGCGKNKQPGFVGVDSLNFEGVDVVTDLRKPWPWADGSVDDVHCSHFFEHLTNPERCHFWNELYRVLKPGMNARVITPHWSHACAYGDPTHVWPGVSEWAVMYTNKQWRDQNAPHCNEILLCDFDWQYAGTWDQWLEVKAIEVKQDAMAHYINSYRDIIFTVIKTVRPIVVGGNVTPAPVQVNSRPEAPLFDESFKPNVPSVGVATGG